MLNHPDILLAWSLTTNFKLNRLAKQLEKFLLTANDGVSLSNRRLLLTSTVLRR
jgi:hypothetical protein